MCAFCEAIMASCGAEVGVDGMRFGIRERIDMAVCASHNGRLDCRVDGRVLS